MYNVDEAKINRILSFLELRVEQGKDLLTRQAPNQEDFTTVVHQLTMERMIILFLETFTDVANLLIDGFIMRDPGSYEDMVDIMEDEEVIDRETAVILLDLIRLYRDLKMAYTEITYDQVEYIFNESLDTMGRFSSQVKAYLKQELQK